MLKKQLTEELILAVKNKNKESTNTIRLIIAAIKDKEIAFRTESKDKEVTEEIIYSILKGMIKQRNESIELYEKGNRAELVDKEKKEIEIIKKFLPKQLDESEVKNICNELIKELNASNMSDMGKVMSELKKHKLASQIDMSNASSCVKMILSS